MSEDEALDLSLEALKNVTVTGPDDDGLVWINLPGNGTTGKAILRVGKAGLIAAQCAKLYEEQRTKAITAIKQARAAPVQEPVAWMHTMIDDVVVGHRPADLNVHPDRWMPLYKDPTPCKTCEALARTVMMDQTAHDTTPPAAPVQEPVAWVDLLKAAEQIVKEKFLYKRFIGGTPLANDIPCWMATFAQEHATPPAAQRQWVDPNEKSQKQFLPHIGEPVLFCHDGVTYFGKHTGGSFTTGQGITTRNFNTWECHWMYPPSAKLKEKNA